MKNLLLLVLLTALTLGLMACGSGASDADTAAPAAESGLTEAQLKNGIGPITEVSLASEVDAALAAQGDEIFSMKCTTCHKMDTRYVGPPLGDVLEHRTPEYVMNMMLNPAEMLEKHPAAKELLAQYMTPMPSQNLTREEARAILEYLRQAGAEVTAQAQ